MMTQLSFRQIHLLKKKNLQLMTIILLLELNQRTITLRAKLKILRMKP
jgi:hypothetical protein